MSAKTIGKSFGFGFAGSFARQHEMIITTKISNDSKKIMFGSPLMYSATDGTGEEVKNVDNSFTTSKFAGVASAIIKTMTDVSTQNDGGFYSQNEPVSAFQKGSISVICKQGSPKINGRVYVRIVDNLGQNKMIGDFEAVADGSNSIELPNCRWGSEKDGQNIAELVILTRSNV